MRGSKILIILVVVCLCLPLASCKKMADASKPTGPLTYEQIKFTDAVPQDFGNLIAVTQSSDRNWMGLWFQKSDGTIVVIPVNGVDGRFGDRMMRIPRK